MSERTARAPIQERAQRRRESLLDAAARLLDREGYDALTTNAVAAEAQASIGTVYEYFRNREAIIEGLLARFAERLAGVVDEALGDSSLGPLEKGDRVVDAFARFWKTEPGYRATWLSTQLSGFLAATGARWSDAFVERIAKELRTVAKGAPPAFVRRVAFTAVHLVSGLLLAMVTTNPQQERSLIAETKIALRAYLAARLASIAL
jgi:AcrR family transcriptional regulator